MPPALKSPYLRSAWNAAWIVGAMVHLTQSIWFSGWQAVPAGLGDGRFNHLVLEHGYLSFAGFYDWLNPGQFFPATHTLGWSDTHLGTLPFYIGLRLAGLSADASWQMWFIGCATLNLIAGYQLMRRLRISEWWIGPALFAALAGPIMVWLAGSHPQLLPLFPTLWAFSQLIAYWDDGQRSRLFIGMGAILWQFAAAPYLAFFAGFIGLALIAVKWTSGGPRPPRTSSPSTLKFKSSLVTLAALGIGLGIVNAWVYAHALESGHGRPMQEVIDLAPTWRSWFSAPAVSFWYPETWPGHSSEKSEQVLFSGFLPWVCMLLAMRVGWRTRQNVSGSWLLAFSATAALTVLFFVKWPNGFSFWLILADWFEPLRAFRAPGRIALFTHLCMVISAGLLLSSTRPGSWRTGFRSALLLGLAAEGLTHHQPRYRLDAANARVLAITDAWTAAGDHPVLAFAPGHTNQPDPFLQLDAWAAALSTRRHTINGYSGGVPASHLPFIWNPDEVQARALQHSQGIPDEQISVVTQFPESVATAVDYTYLNSRSLRYLEDFDLQPFVWNLFSPLEHFTFEGQSYYQFTPPCEVRFKLPDAVTTIEFLTGMRPGPATTAGHSDGYTLAVRVETAGGILLSHAEEFINPRDNPDHRGFLARAHDLPAGTDRILIFAWGPGPGNSNAWDWPLLGRLRLR